MNASFLKSEGEFSDFAFLGKYSFSLNLERTFIDDSSPSNDRERRKEGVLPYEGYLQLQEQLKDYLDIRSAKNEERDAPITPVSEANNHLKYQA